MLIKYKLVFTIPVSHADKAREAIGKAGAGKQGNYSFCSFSSQGIGRFVPEQGAHPTIGEVGKLAEVEEERIECLVDSEMIKDVIVALKSVHPYEEIVYDIYSLADLN